MAETVEDFLIEEIRRSGPISIARFMHVVLAHPRFGYYMTRDPLGAAGDFTTAPEISQMFGEMIGAWVVDLWVKMGAPSRLNLVECGPGRGTLMRDLLCMSSKVQGFAEAVHVHLIEISPVLMVQQRELLAGSKVQWHGRLDEVPDDAPMILIANEFLDALPFAQLQYSGGMLQERVIDYNDGFRFVLCPAADSLLAFVPAHVWPLAENAIIEVAPARQAFLKNTAERLAQNRGAALFIDYGFERLAAGESFQAMKGHEFVDVLAHIGQADLTSHVDFGVFASVAKDCGVSLAGPRTQRDFLRALGIEMRAARLAQVESGGQIDRDLERLIGRAQMGELFKVAALYDFDDAPIVPEGF